MLLIILKLLYSHCVFKVLDLRLFGVCRDDRRLISIAILRRSVDFALLRYFKFKIELLKHSIFARVGYFL